MMRCTNISVSYTHLDVYKRQALEYVGNDGTYGDGTGTVVAVIDTELDFRHEYFTMKELGTGRLTKAYVDGISPYLSTASFQRDSYYVSEKLPYVANYENYTANTYCDAQDIVHGSHVSGIAAGNGAGASGSRYQISGNAPNAQLVFMGNAHLRDETLFASFDDCLYLEVDVVNCSFGAEGEMCIRDRVMCANVDFYSGLVYTMLNIPKELFTPIFAISRIAGWSAHRLEELAVSNRIIRPAYKNVGQKQPYVDLSDRREGL